MKKSHKFDTERTYFSCLDIYESSIPYDLEEDIENTIDSSFARQPGSILLSRYKIMRVLQENTFGFIYLVEKINKNTTYIIKEFFPHKYVTRNDKDDMILNTPLDIDSLIRFNYMQNFFMGEANSLEKISIKPHSNILKVTSIEKNKNNTSYIIYPLKKGMTLQKFMETKIRTGNGKLEKDEVDKLLNPLMDAVEHLHTLNIYHLNIKSENIFILEDGSFLLLGLESSTFFNDEDSRVFCNAYTPEYAAPEQLNSDNTSNIGKESDIYAIGVLLYKLIVGNFPPSASERMVCSQKDIANDPYVPIAEKKEFSNNYDINFLKMIDKCMMLSPKDRFKDIASLRKSLSVGSVAKADNILKNKRNYLLYLLLLPALIYVIFEGFKKIDNNSELASNMVQEYISKNKENKSIENVKDVKNERIILEKEEREDKQITLDENSRIKNINRDENSLNNIEKIDKNNTFSSKNKIEELPLKEETKTDVDMQLSEEIKLENEVRKKMEEMSAIVTEPSKIQVINMEMDKPTKIKEIDIEMTEAPKIKKISIDENKSGDVENVDTNHTLLLNRTEVTEKVKAVSVKIEEKILTQNVKEKTRKSAKDRLKKRKTHIKRKTKIKKKVRIQRKKPLLKRGSGLVWYCKAIGGNIRSSARNLDKGRSKNIALSQCRRKSSSKQSCRILNCFLVR